MSKIPTPLIRSGKIRLAIVGKVDENDHPYSWSALFNGYDPGKMARWADPIISNYLNKQPKESLRISGAEVSHIWTDDPVDAERIAEACFIPTMMQRPEEAIGQVDAVLVPTDKGDEHVRRCHFFARARVPLFIDKPLVDNESDLKVVNDWIAQGIPLMSCSFMRYCKEYMPYRASTHNLGKIRFAAITTPKSWERYGIHALEGIYPILGPGFVSARNTGTRDRNVVHLRHESGADVVVVASNDMFGALGVLQLCGTAGYAQVAMSDRYFAFKSQLEAFVQYLRTGIHPFPFSETQELMKILIAGIRSREENAREVMLSEICSARDVRAN